MPILVANDSFVEDFVLQQTKMVRNDGMKSIGLIDDCGVIAGVIYENFNGHNIFMHVAAEPGRHWLTRRTLYEFFAYPFITCGVDRVTGWVEASNTKARKLDEHLGFRVEAVLSGAASDGGDILIMVLWKKDCRFLGGKYGQKINSRA